jgi:hypothetical protein
MTAKLDALESTFHALFRAFHFHEAPLPELWDVQIRAGKDADEAQMKFGGERDDLSGVKGELMPWAVRAVLVNSDEGFEKRVRPGQYVPCRIEVVDPVAKAVFVRAVGPGSHRYTQTDPIRIFSHPRADAESKTDSEDEIVTGVDSGREKGTERIGDQDRGLPGVLPPIR